MSTSQTQVVAPAKSPAHKAPLGLRSVAAFELFKGVLFLTIGLSALFLIHRDVDQAAENIVHLLHLDPAWHYCKIFIDESAKVTDTRLRLIALVSLTLAAIRFVEGYGLWHERPWAEWLAVISATVYIPIELRHFYNYPTRAAAVIFLVNVAIVLYLGLLLAANHRRKVLERAAALS